MTNTIKSIIMNIINAHKPYSGSTMLMALYFVALLIMIFYWKDVKSRKAIVVPTMIMLAIMYVLIPVYNATIGNYSVYYVGRTFWILITPIITAIGFTLFITNIEDKKMRYWALAMMFPLALFCGNFKLSNDMFVKPENVYRLPQCTVDVVEHVLAETEQPKLIVPYTIAHPFRQISTDVHLLYGEDASYGRIVRTSDELIEVSDQMLLETPDLNYIVPVAREHDVNYILFDTVYTRFCEDGDINIYGYPVDDDYVADRTATVSFDELKPISVVDDEKGVYWDLSEYGLEYGGTFGQYVLYRVV